MQETHSNLIGSNGKCWRTEKLGLFNHLVEYIFQSIFKVYQFSVTTFDGAHSRACMCVLIHMHIGRQNFSAAFNMSPENSTKWLIVDDWVSHRMVIVMVIENSQTICLLYTTVDAGLLIGSQLIPMKKYRYVESTFTKEIFSA